MAVHAHTQRDQPPGVPPLELTGERTLPDVPAENYWYRRHLAVYEWIGARVIGKRVLDMACGEGYGSAVLARGAETRARRRRQPGGVRARPPALRRPEPALRAGDGREPRRDGWDFYDAVVFLQTIEHVQDPVAVLRHFRSLLAPGRFGVCLDPQPADARAGRGPTSPATPGTSRSTAPTSSTRSAAPCSAHVELLGLFHARKLRIHELALACGWDAVHTRLGLTKPFYDRFTPAISARDFALRPSGLDGALDFLAVCF